MRKFEFLREWDDELASYPSGVRVVIIFLIPTIILWLGWEFWISSLIQEIDNISNQNIKLERKISKVSPKRFETKIAILKNRKNRIKNSIEDSSYRLKHIKSEAYQYSFLWFDENKFLIILKKILKYSVKLGIRIDKIESIPIHKREISPHISIGEMIKIEGAGSYSNIIKMLYYIDSLEILLEIKSIEIWLDNDELKFRVKITQYGITL